MTATELSDRDRLAAEHALRLLEGEDLVTARGLMASDPDFAALVAQWQERLAPLLDEVGEAAPRPEVWAEIQRKLAHDVPGGEVVALRKRVRQWQFASMASAAAAIALAFFAFVQPAQPPANAPDIPARSAPLMANIPIGETPLRLAVTYIPDRTELLVSASGLTADGVHDHELWLIMPQGAPQSLGVVIPGEERRVAVDPAVAAYIGAGAQMVLTREPLGGAPKGGAAGPVVAQGQFLQS